MGCERVGDEVIAIYVDGQRLPVPSAAALDEYDEALEDSREAVRERRRQVRELQADIVRDYVGSVAGFVLAPVAGVVVSRLGRFGSRFRDRLHKVNPRPTGGIFDAHHIFPQQFRSWFTARGIDIDNPRFGTWWAHRDHRRNWRRYNADWEEWIERNSSAKPDEILAFGRQMCQRWGQSCGF
jgi:hypothetical protein